MDRRYDDPGDGQRPDGDARDDDTPGHGTDQTHAFTTSTAMPHWG